MSDRRTRYGKTDDGCWVEETGIVIRLFSSDSHCGSHQRLIVQTGNRQTLLVSHNTDVAERVPLSLGDRITFRGLYEWNDQGGLVHWTHCDPMGGEDGGWIQFRGKRYA